MCTSIVYCFHSEAISTVLWYNCYKCLPWMSKIRGQDLGVDQKKLLSKKKNFFFASVLQIQLYRKVLQKKKGGAILYSFKVGVFSLMCSCKFAWRFILFFVSLNYLIGNISFSFVYKEHFLLINDHVEICTILYLPCYCSSATCIG